jgi:hypothetical protein
MSGQGFEVERREGPTLHGGAYKLVARFEDGTVHITEYLADGTWHFETVSVLTPTVDEALGLVSGARASV